VQDVALKNVEMRDPSTTHGAVITHFCVARRQGVKNELPIKELRRYKTPSINHIPAELIKAGGRTIHSELHKLIHSIWNNKELPEQWKDSIIVSVYKKGSKTDCSNCRGI